MGATIIVAFLTIACIWGLGTEHKESRRKKRVEKNYRDFLKNQKRDA